MNDLPIGIMSNGMRVIESTLATVSEPVRKHNITRQQLKHLEKHMFKGITYHDRIQKKWNKRFGFKHVPGCFIVDTSKLTFGDINGGEKVIMAHPTVVKAMKEHEPPATSHVRNESILEIYDAMRKKAKDDRELRGRVLWRPEYSFSDFPILNRRSVLITNCIS